MKQIAQNYRSGKVEMCDVPAPSNKPGHLLVRNMASLVSVGTEKAMMEMARKSLVGKALARPDLVRQVLSKALTEGFVEAYRQAMARLDAPVPLGYSSAGVVVQVGPGVEGFELGADVSCAGHPQASHAEVVRVPAHLCVRLPQGVSFESGAFVMLGGIAMHAVRLAEVSLGERVVVIGLGLLGQLAVQILAAAGCKVFGSDVDAEKAEMAQQNGAESVAVGRQHSVDAVRGWTSGRGADAVLVFASAAGNEPLELASEVARDRARIVVPGLVGLEVPRRLFYEKELQLIVSRAAGPGAYDPEYEIKGFDYPLPYVRWTWQRNMAEFIDLLGKGKLSVDHLITHRFPIERAMEAYELILKGKEKYIGVVLTYPLAAAGTQGSQTVELSGRPLKGELIPTEAGAREGPVGLGVIGAGLFASSMLLPALRRMRGVSLRGLATATGLSAQHTGKKFGFRYATTDYHQLLEDPHIGCVLIATRHHLHASLTIEALRAGKHVFVEKPLALDIEQLRAVAEALNSQSAAGGKLLMVGFNRRFSPFAIAAKSFLGEQHEPLVLNCRVNAGYVPGNSWVHDPVEGGGRIVGEVCHFVDLVQFLTGSHPVSVFAESLPSGGAYRPSDNVVVSLKLADGSIGTITYTAAGDKGFPRERIEVLGGGAVVVIDNFMSATFMRGGRVRRMRHWWSVDRGHGEEMRVLISAVRSGGVMPVPLESYLLTTLATFKIEESLVKGIPLTVSLEDLRPPQDAS